MSFGIRTWAPIGPFTSFPDHIISSKNTELDRWRRRRNYVLAFDTAQGVYLFLSALSCLANQALEDEISFIEPHTKGARIVPRPHGVELGKYLDLKVYQGVLVPANRTDRGFRVHAQLQIHLRDSSGFSCTADGSRPVEGYCARISIVDSAPQIKAGRFLHVELEVPDAYNQAHVAFSFLPLFNMIRTVVNDPDGSIVLTLSRDWVTQIRFIHRSVGDVPPPLSDHLIRISEKATRVAGLTDHAASTAYGAISWFALPQLAPADIAATAGKPQSDEASAIVLGCQMAELARALGRHAAGKAHSRYRFLLASDVPRGAGRRGDKAGRLLCQALAARLGEYVVLSGRVFGGAGSLDAAWGMGGVDELYARDPAGMSSCRHFDSGQPDSTVKARNVAKKRQLFQGLLALGANGGCSIALRWRASAILRPFLFGVTLQFFRPLLQLCRHQLVAVP